MEPIGSIRILLFVFFMIIHEHWRSSEVEGVGEADGFGDVGESR